MSTSTATSRASDRERFLAEARRVAPELVVVDAALRDDTEPEEQQERILNDGSRWTVYKRYFTAAGLAEELGGGETVFAGRWFVVVRSPVTRRRSTLPLARLAPARQPRLPRLRRGGLPARVAPRSSSRTGPARVHVRAGAGHRRRRRSAARGGAGPGRRCAAGSSSTRTSSTRRSTAPPSRAATRASAVGARRPRCRRRASRSSARSGATGSSARPAGADRPGRRPRDRAAARLASAHASASARGSERRGASSCRCRTRPARARWPNRREPRPARARRRS